MLGIVIVNYRSDALTSRFVREELSRIRLPHVTVVVDNGGAKEGVMTDLDGIFAIAVPAGTDLEFSSVGFKCYIIT